MVPSGSGSLLSQSDGHPTGARHIPTPAGHYVQPGLPMVRPTPPGLTVPAHRPAPQTARMPIPTPRPAGPPTTGTRAPTTPTTNPHHPAPNGSSSNGDPGGRERPPLPVPSLRGHAQQRLLPPPARRPPPPQRSGSGPRQRAVRMRRPLPQHQEPLRPPPRLPPPTSTSRGC